MFHAARAVLFQVTGRAPKTHHQTLQQFGLLVRDLDDALRGAGKALNAAKDERSTADYDETTAPSPQEARDALQAAIEVLAVCNSRYGLPQEPPEGQ